MPQQLRPSSRVPAAPGWDPVTGLGSPDAQVLVPLLMGVVFAGLGFWPVYMNAREPQTVETDEMELLA